MSAEDIKPGQQWFKELSNVLDETRFAIVCLTKSNMSAPWVMFEAGAVSGHLGELKVVPLLEGDQSDLVDPMAHFHATTFDQNGVRLLFESINDSVGKPFTKKALGAALAAEWPELEASVKAAIAQDKAFDVFLSVPMAAFESDTQYEHSVPRP